MSSRPFEADEQGVFFRCLASSVDLAHAVLMLAWGLGLPLLFWHRWPRIAEIDDPDEGPIWQWRLDRPTH